VRSGLEPGPGGYDQGGMSTVSELRIPADRAYVVVAKRAAAGFATVAGFDVEAIDDLTIAVAQACENAIVITERVSGEGSGQMIKLVFKLENGRLDIQVKSAASAASTAARDAQAAMVPSKDAVARARAHAAEAARQDAIAATDLALRVMALFVDDCRSRVDERTGGLRVRLTKYRAS
jgi:hypothetical protein